MYNRNYQITQVIKLIKLKQYAVEKTMNIEQVQDILRQELALERTPKGRPISELGKNAIEAVLSDEKNYGVMAVKCLNCGMVFSSVLSHNGCPNCGGMDLTANLDEV